MEQAQIPPVKVKKRRFGYLKEFFMLFLAVYLGFLSENLRQRNIEKSTEKQYMRSMLADLEQDTEALQNAIQGNTIFLIGLDTLLNLLASPQSDVEYQRNVFMLSLMHTYWYMPVEFSEITMLQLKNSGGYKLIKDAEVASAIIRYNQGIEECKSNYILLSHYYHIYEEVNKELFNMQLARSAFKYIELDFNNIFNVEEVNALVPEGQYLDSNDPKLFASYHDDLLYYQTTLSNVNHRITRQKTAAEELIMLIIENYGLDK